MKKLFVLAVTFLLFTTAAFAEQDIKIINKLVLVNSYIFDNQGATIGTENYGILKLEWEKVPKKRHAIIKSALLNAATNPRPCPAWLTFDPETKILYDAHEAIGANMATIKDIDFSQIDKKREHMLAVTTLGASSYKFLDKKSPDFPELMSKISQFDNKKKDKTIWLAANPGGVIYDVMVTLKAF